MSIYQVVKCDECHKPLHVRPEGMQAPHRFIITCTCGHLQEYFSQEIQLMPMQFKPLRELPKESKEGDLERMVEEIEARCTQ